MLGMHLVGSGPGAETRFGWTQSSGEVFELGVLDLSLQGGPLLYNHLLGNGIQRDGAREGVSGGLCAGRRQRK